MSTNRLGVVGSVPCSERLDRHRAWNMAYVYHGVRTDQGLMAARAEYKLSGEPEDVSGWLTSAPESYTPLWVIHLLKRYASPGQLPLMPFASTVIRHCPRADHADGTHTRQGSGVPEVVSRDLWIPHQSPVHVRRGMDPKDPGLAEVDREGIGLVPVTLASGKTLMVPAIALPLTVVERDSVQGIDVVPLATGSFASEQVVLGIVHVLGEENGRRLSIERVHRVADMPAAA